MIFDDVRKFALSWPEVADGTSYGTPALKVRKKLLARLKEDGDGPVIPGVPPDERDMLAKRDAHVFDFHRSLQGLPDRAGPVVQGEPRDSRALAATAVAGFGRKGHEANVTGEDPLDRTVTAPHPR